MAGLRVPGPARFAAGMLAVFAAALPLAYAQKTAPPAAPAPAAAAHPSLTALSQQRNLWPAELTLKVSVRLSIVANGQAVGSIESPDGTTVTLISVDPTGLEIGVGAARATVSPDQTDLWDRLATAAPKAAPPASPAPVVPSNPVTTAAPAPPPHPTPAVPPPKPAEAPATSAPLVFDTEIAPQGNLTKTAYHFWSPPYNHPIRGVIVLVPGFNGDGRHMTDSPSWQGLARKYGLALVGCFLQGKSYYVASRGSGNALEEALHQFAGQANRAEIARVPLLLYGESAGGQFDYDFVLTRPDRVMAFVINKGAYYEQDPPDARTCAVPGLFFLGLKDSELRVHAITAIWTTGRNQGALWALAPQPNSGHEFSKTAAVAQVFFESVLKKRMPDDMAGSDEPAPMKPIQENEGWLGDLQTHAIHHASTDTEISHTAAWLPDEASAKAWQAFVSP